MPASKTTIQIYRLNGRNASKNDFAIGHKLVSPLLYSSAIKTRRMSDSSSGCIHTSTKMTNTKLTTATMMTQHLVCVAEVRQIWCSQAGTFSTPCKDTFAFQNEFVVCIEINPDASSHSLSRGGNSSIMDSISGVLLQRLTLGYFSTAGQCVN